MPVMTRRLAARGAAEVVLFDPVLLGVLGEDDSIVSTPFARAGAIDWSYTADRAYDQGVAPLLYHKLSAAGQIDRLPEVVVRDLRHAHHTSWTKSVLHLRALEHLLGVLAGAGICPVLLKGAGLVLTVYAHPALRPMRDIDLLVSPAEFRPALHQLLDAGCRVTHDEPFTGAYETVTHHVGLLFRHGIEVLVELHHQWLSIPAQQGHLVSVDELRARGSAVRVGQARAYVLSAEDQVLQLSGHIAIHSPVLEKLIWYYDVDRVIRGAGPVLAWETILDRAQRYCMVLPLQQVLPIAVQHLGTPVPPPVLDRLAGLPVTAAERQRFGPAALGPHSRLTDGLQKLAGLPGFGAKLRFVWGSVMPTWAYMHHLYPDDSPARLASRYPARWLEVLREFTQAAQRYRRIC